MNLFTPSFPVMCILELAISKASTKTAFHKNLSNCAKHMAQEIAKDKIGKLNKKALSNERAFCKISIVAFTVLN